MNMYDFIHQCAPHLNRRAVTKAEGCSRQADVDALFADLQLEARLSAA